MPPVISTAHFGFIILSVEWTMADRLWTFGIRFQIDTVRYPLKWLSN